MKEKKKSLLIVLCRLCIFAIAAAFICAYGTFSFNIGQKLVSLSAKTFLPQKGLRFENFEASENSQNVTESKKDEAVTGTSLKTDGLDSDVLLLMNKAIEKSVDEKIGGKIKEYTYTSDGVTDSFDAVKVKNVNKTQVDIESLLKEKADLTVEKGEPSVLIYHTHTTETYQLLDRGFYGVDFKARTTDKGQNMVRVGKAICSEIEKAGFKVIHDTEIYDSPYSGAYYRSEDKAKAYLKKYPSIDITLDIHRDAIESDGGVKTKPTAVIDGKKAAQLMIISGCQEQDNGITDLPDWKENLVFALQLQNKAETMFPGLMRPLYFCPRSYNMNLTHCSLLIEMGSDANTLSEAVYSGKLLGKAIAEILKEYSVD